MSSQRLYCGPEQRDRLGDDGRPVSLHVSARGCSLASVSDDLDRLIATADLRYADLLAAAPELLAALKDAVAQIEASEFPSPTDYMRDIIAKAEGR